MPEQPKSALRRWVLPAVRYGLCIVAIVFIVQTVNIHDRLVLSDGTRVRLLAERDDGFLIQENGSERLVAPADVEHRTIDGADGPVRVPHIVYGIRGVVRNVNWGQALWALLIFAPVWVIQSYRLVLMVQVQGVALGLWNAVKLTYAGCFFNFALPGSVGGDVIKAYYLARYTHSKKTEVVTTVFLDRAIGLFGLLVIAVAAIAIHWDPEAFGRYVAVLVGSGVALIIGAIVIFSRRIRGLLRLADLARALPLGEQILRVGRATTALRRHKGRVLASLLLTLVLQFLVLWSAAVMAWALGMKGEALYFFVYIAFGFLIAAIPVNPPQAFGVMEGVYVLFLTASHVNTASQAVALALAVRLIQLVWSLPGALVPIFGAHLPRRDELEGLGAETDAGLPEVAGAGE